MREHSNYAWLLTAIGTSGQWELARHGLPVTRNWSRTCARFGHWWSQNRWKIEDGHIFSVMMGGCLTLMASCLYNKAPLVFPVFPMAYAVDYTVGAVGYHCKRLAEVYAEISRHFPNVIRFFPKNTTGLATFPYVPEPYYEFDALITAARRAYDSTRYLLWYSFGPRNSSTPS